MDQDPVCAVCVQMHMDDILSIFQRFQVKTTDD